MDIVKFESVAQLPRYSTTLQQKLNIEKLKGTLIELAQCGISNITDSQISINELPSAYLIQYNQDDLIHYQLHKYAIGDLVKIQVEVIDFEYTPELDYLKPMFYRFKLSSISLVSKADKILEWEKPKIWNILKIGFYWFIVGILLGFGKGCKSYGDNYIGSGDHFSEPFVYIFEFAIPAGIFGLIIGFLFSLANKRNK